MISPKEITYLTTFEVAQERLPLWTTWGVQDAGICIHSLGVTYLTSLGTQLGYVSVSEYPAPRGLSHDHVTEDVRSDSVWFDRATQEPVFIAEFERYSGKHKDLSFKMESLLLAQHRWSRRGLTLLLAYWTVGLVSLPNHEQLQRIVRVGYETRQRERVIGHASAHVVFLQFVVSPDEHDVLRLTKIIQRGSS